MVIDDTQSSSRECASLPVSDGARQIMAIEGIGPAQVISRAGERGALRMA